MPLPFPNIPQPTDFLSVSQDQIRQNFVSLDSVVGGVYDQQGAAPATAATQLALFSMAGLGGPQLFLRRQNSTGLVSLTDYIMTGGAVLHGFTMLPSGLCLKFGSGNTVAAPGFGDITYDATHPFIANPIVLVSTLVGSVNYSAVVSRGAAPNNLTTLRVYNCPVTLNHGVQFIYYAIGPVV